MENKIKYFLNQQTRWRVGFFFAIQADYKISFGSKSHFFACLQVS
jgi:hypothetical protein